MLDAITSYFSNSHLWAFLVATPLIVVGFIGTFLPVLPGTVLIYGAFAIYGLMTGFENTGWPFFLGQLGLVGLSYLVDFASSAYGVKMYGGSKAAVWGAVLGSLLIFVIGPLGLLIGPLLGAVAGEMIAGEELRRALHAGFGTFIGLVGGTIIRLLIASVMIAWFLWQTL
ncbi:MAG: DUF456 domain-containing protein [Desulfobulbaceae bacterium]